MRTSWPLCFLFLYALMGVTIQENVGSPPQELNDFLLRVERSSAHVRNEPAKHSSWKLRDSVHQNALHVEDARRAKNMADESQPSALRKSDRKAEPDVQDIISGIVHLLGAKVNLQAASGVDPNAGLKSALHSSRINNRAPPLATQVPFEAIPLQFSNLGPPRPPGQQPPFGVPLRRPLWPPTVNNPGQNLQNLPFGSGVPLPLQLVPPMPNPIPLRPALEPPSTLPTHHQPVLRANITEPTTTPQEEEISMFQTTEDIIPGTQPEAAEEEALQVDQGNVYSPAPSEESSSTWDIQPSSTEVLLQTPSVAVSLPASTTTSQSISDASASIVPVVETSSLEAILQPSIEDVTTTQAEVTSPTPLQLPVSAIFTSHSPFIETFSGTTQLTQTPSYVSTHTSTVPQIDGGQPYFSPLPQQPLTPPLSRPGHVFHESYVTPQTNQVAAGNFFIPQSSIGDTFELVLSASQNFGSAGGNEPHLVPGKPHVIPVNIGEIRGGQETLVTTAPSETDEFVSIDGRRTYFNLFPTTVSQVAATSQPSVVQTTSSLQQRLPPQTQAAGSGSIFPTHNSANLARPASAPVVPQRTFTPPTSSKPTPPLIRKPAATTPALSRIDACIVGDPTTCSDPNEICRTEDHVSSCSCKGGYGRRRSSDACKALAGIVVSLKVDRLNSQPLHWSAAYTDPDSHEYKQLQWESRQAVTSLIGLIPLAPLYVSSTVNKFYPLGNKVVINSTVFLDQTAETQSVAVRSQLQKQLVNAIQQHKNNIGISRLWVDASLNPVPLVQDLNECVSADLNDCHENAECFNIPGSFQCRCRPGYLDPFVNDPHKAGRRCESCSSDYCNNRGECRVENGKKVCQCRGHYQGAQCDVDGEVLGVAIGASVAAVVIIILTLVFLCLWSKRWRRNQEKVERGLMNQMAQKTMLFPTLMQDRIRWAQIAEAMAAQNLYAPDPVNVNHNLALIGAPFPVGTMAGMGRMNAAPMGGFHRARSTTGSVHSFGKQRRAPPPPSNPPPSFPVEISEESATDSDATLRASRPFHVPRPRSRASTTASSNIYYEADLPSLDFSQVSLNTYRHRQHPLHR